MDFEVDLLCREPGLSKTRLYQKIRNVTSQSIVEFVRSYRLKKAKEIMTHEDVSLTEVNFRAGIQTPPASPKHLYLARDKLVSSAIEHWFTNLSLARFKKNSVKRPPNSLTI